MLSCRLAAAEIRPVFNIRLNAVVQLKLYRVRGHTHAVIFFSRRSCNIRIDRFIRELRRLLSGTRGVSPARSALLPEEPATCGISFALLPAKQVIQVFVHSFARVNLILNPVQTGISRAAKHKRVSRRVGKRTSIRRAFRNATTGIRMEAERGYTRRGRRHHALRNGTQTLCRGWWSNFARALIAFGVFDDAADVITALVQTGRHICRQNRLVPFFARTCGGAYRNRYRRTSVFGIKVMMLTEAVSHVMHDFIFVNHNFVGFLVMVLKRVAASF